MGQYSTFKPQRYCWWCNFFVETGNVKKVRENGFDDPENIELFNEHEEFICPICGNVNKEGYIPRVEISQKTLN